MEDYIISFLDPCGCCSDKEIIEKNEFVSNTFVISSNNLKIRKELKNNIKSAIKKLNNIILKTTDINKISVVICEKFLPPGVLGSAGPNPNNFQTTEKTETLKFASSGEIYFNSLYASASENVIIHELMHILGLGFWEKGDPFGANYSVRYIDSKDKSKPWYYLQNSKAIEAYQKLIFDSIESDQGEKLIENMGGETWVDYNGVPFSENNNEPMEDRVKNTFTAIPIEDKGGEGTALGHFEEGFIGNGGQNNSGINSRNIRMKKGGTPRDPIGDEDVVILYPSLTEEISTGIDDRSETKFSSVMCGALEDLGHQVNNSNADSFIIKGLNKKESIGLKEIKNNQ